MSRFVAEQRIREAAASTVPGAYALERVEKVSNQDGEPAWVGTFRRRSGGRTICVAVWEDPRDIAHWPYDVGDSSGAGV